MKKCKVTVFPGEKSIEVPEGTVLLNAILDLGLYIGSDCGGQGVCGRCKIVVEKGDRSVGCTTHLTDSEIEEGFCLACLTLVEGDMRVRIPSEMKVEEKAILASREGEKIALGHWLINPRTRKIHLKLPFPTLDDSISDLERIKRELKKHEGGRNNILHCSLDVLRSMGKTLREGDWDITLTLLGSGKILEIMDVEAGNATSHSYGLAIDVGTTTVVVYLVDLINGQVKGIASDYNSQVRCGEDVISRIVYAQKGGLDRLHRLIIADINKLTEKVCRKSHISPERIESLVVAGNTTMTHLLLGIDPTSIRQEPYIPSANFYPLIRACDLKLKVNSRAYLYCMPCISSYVGGDITAGVLRSEIHKKDGLTLFIDAGTNGEIVLGNSEWLIAASCSAGPAFEGGGVKFGMRATSGAIERVQIDSKTKEPVIAVVGEGKPKGICGSGIVDILAELFLCGIVNQKGKLETSFDRVQVVDGVAEYILVPGKETETGEDIVFTEIDIDNIIRAKGAIYSGFCVLLKEMGMTFDDVDQFLIAGGIGNYLNIENAIIIGLLPDIPPGKFKYLGNSSVIGAQLALLSMNLTVEAEEIAHKMTNLELSVSSHFMEEYMASLFLPHTDMAQFPTARKALLKRRIGKKRIKPVAAGLVPQPS